jgi:hypothetical protein
MLNLGITLLIIALVAAVLGFAGLPVLPSGLTKITFLRRARAPDPVIVIWRVPPAAMVMARALVWGGRRSRAGRIERGQLLPAQDDNL